MKEFKKRIAAALHDAVSVLWPECGLDTAQLQEMLEYPPDEAMGNLALPCFKLSRTLRSAPPAIASALADKMQECGIAEVSAAGGYLNFRFSYAYLLENVLTAVEAKKDAYGSSDVGTGKTVVLDYSSPNTSKPFHIGHLGTTVIGHSLKLLHEFCGYTCIGINHLGDWGTQNGKQIVAYRKWGDKATVEEKGCDGLVELYVKFHEEAEKDPSLNDQARAEFKKMEEHVPENIELWKWFLEISLKEYNVTYKQLGITFDYYMGESFFSDKMPAQIQIMRDKGLLKLDNGASIVDLSDYNMPPCLILKSDGTTLYPSRDIAAAVYRKNTFAFDKCIYVTSAGQNLHFAQWFKVMELMGYDWVDQLVHVPYGTVSIGGEKLATRTGNVVLLKDLFRQSIEKVYEIMNEKNPDLPNREDVAEAVGVGAIVFHYLYNSRIKDINFTLENALSFEGNTGPYAQYTYARTCSILEKAGDLDLTGDAQITAPEEAALLVVLSKFPEKVDDAVAQYEPSVITRYVIDVCTAFNRFYQNCPILTVEDQAVRASRVRLARAAGTVIRNALRLICIRTPEKI
ncbi:MAG: arginine--tRNA ligase [Ruminococcaceae bacterium]|nr:arginine--tRNA ligase [Oscillospiraceae bacterium]